jgi:hypothetical protein
MGGSPNRLNRLIESFVCPDPGRPAFLDFTHPLCTQVPTHRNTRLYIQSMALSFPPPSSPRYPI